MNLAPIASPFLEGLSPSGAPPLFLCRGSVWHRRLRPGRNEFTYPGFFLLLPMRAWRDGRIGTRPMPRNRAGWMSFHDSDHGLGGPDALLWFEQLLHAEGVTDADGEIWLQTYPRLLGYVFNPVSFWYATRSDGSLAAIVAEVNNTFGERHCYLLQGPRLHWGSPLRARKVFHVSPFCHTSGTYTFRFRARAYAPGRRAGTLVARVDYDDGEGPLLQTAVAGVLQPLTRASLLRLAWDMPFMTLGVILRIHWQALRLLAKRVPFLSKPPPPMDFVSR